MKLNSISHIYAPTGFHRDCIKIFIPIAVQSGLR